MIAGFDIETGKLSDTELKVIVPRVVDGFMRMGHSTIPSSVIIRKLQSEGIHTTGSRLRKVINHIRRNHLVLGLIADSNGYRIARSANEYLEYIRSLEGRVKAINDVCHEMKHEYNMMVNQHQQKLEIA